MATTIIPVDQSKYSRIMIVSTEPKMALAQDEDGAWSETDIQATSRDGDEKQWNVQAAFVRPTKYGNRPDIYTVTITGPDPSAQVMEGERVEFDNLAAVHTDPAIRDGKIKGGRINWQADGVRSHDVVGFLREYGGRVVTTPDYDARLSAVREHVEGLATWLAIWESRDDTRPQPEVRQAANDAMDAIDSMLADLHRIRAQLVTEIRNSDDANAARVDAMLRDLKS